MLTNYIQAAMRKAHYEILPVPRSEDPDPIGNGEGYFGSIPDLQGVWANADTLEVCREELREVLEEWILIGLKMGHPILQIDGIELNVGVEDWKVEKVKEWRGKTGGICAYNVMDT